MGVIGFAIRNPITVAVGAILIALFGIVSLEFVPIQLTPDVARPQATVMTFWPGASPFEGRQGVLSAAAVTCDLIRSIKSGSIIQSSGRVDINEGIYYN